MVLVWAGWLATESLVWCGVIMRIQVGLLCLVGVQALFCGLCGCWCARLGVRCWLAFGGFGVIVILRAGGLWWLGLVVLLWI